MKAVFPHYFYYEDKGEKMSNNRSAYIIDARIVFYANLLTQCQKV